MAHSRSAPAPLLSAPAHLGTRAPDRFARAKLNLWIWPILIQHGWTGPQLLAGKDPHQTPLLIWVLEHVPELARPLIDVLANSMNLYTRDAKGWDPLMWALHRKSPHVAHLLTLGCNADSMDTQGKTALMIAADHKESLEQGAQWVQTLLAKKANTLPAEETTGHTALMIACMRGNLEAVRALLKAGAKVNDGDRAGRTALLHCRDHPQLLAVLLEAGADVNAQDYAGNTALSAAMLAPHPACVQILLRDGANPNLLPDGATPLLLETALRGTHGALLEPLLEAGADPRALVEAMDLRPHEFSEPVRAAWFTAWLKHRVPEAARTGRPRL